MTEQEWLTSTDPTVMLAWLTRGWNQGHRHISERKLRLLCVAFHLQFHGAWDLGDYRLSHDTDGMEDRWAITPHNLAGDWCKPSPEQDQRIKADLLRDIFGSPFQPIPRCQVCLGGGYVPTDRDDSTCEVCRGSGCHVPTAWLTWQGGLIPHMAEQIYAEQDWPAMPVLGDALEDCGADCRELLDHCRGPGPHVRGCWVIDLLRGQS